MNTRRARNVFIAALALSLLIHLVLAGYLRWPLLQEQQEQQIARVRITHIARVPPRTPPPTPQPTPISTPRTRASIAPPAVRKQPRGRAPSVSTVAVGTHRPTPALRTPAPSPSATAIALGPCAGHLNADPSVSATPQAVDLAPEARSSKVSGTAAIRVSLNPDGRVTDARVAQSSGNSGLDDSALQMARAATYTPKYINCKPVAGVYTFTVQFAAW